MAEVRIERLTEPPAPAREDSGGEVVDRAVLAERRARRAEAAEQAQARIAREALRAVEVLELRTAELEQRLQAAQGRPDGAPAASRPPDEREVERLHARVAQLEQELAAARREPPRTSPRPAVGEKADSDDRRVERLRTALSSAIVTIADLRLALQGAQAGRFAQGLEHPAVGAPAAPERLAELARSLRAEPPEPGTAEQLVADLDAARAALLTRPEPLQTGPKPLRRALVALAHDDPSAAARVLTGLLPAQGRAVAGPLDYDLTIAGAGTFAVSVGEGCSVVPIGRRRRRGAAFHLSGDARVLAGMLAGSKPSPGRFARVRPEGRRRRFLDTLAATSLSLEDAARAGASLEPADAMRCLAYAVDPTWTRGWAFTVVQTFTHPDETMHLTARDGEGLAFGAGEPETEPDATVAMSRGAFAALLRGEVPPDRPMVRGDHQAVEVLRIWADRLRRGDGAQGA